MPHDTGAWLPLHLVLVGTLLLAISGVTRLFAVSWSASRPCGDRVVAVQRWLVAVGAAGLAAARELDAPTSAAVAAGVVVAAGVALLGVLLVREARAAKLDRFRPAVEHYLAAVTAGLVGIGLGVAMVDGRAGLRDAHVALNLLGLVGLVVAGTLPTFVATQSRMRTNPAATPGRLRATLGWLTASVAAAALGAGFERPAVEGAALLAYAAGLLHLVRLLPRPGRKQLGWAGPRLVQLAAGGAWWVGAVCVAGARGIAGRASPLSEDVVVALVVGGYVQILLGSLAYLGPVLRGGGHEVLGAGFAATRSWASLAAANLAGLTWVAGWRGLTGALVALLALDLAWRAARLVVPGRFGSTAGPAGG